MTQPTVVIVGGGQAGFQVAVSLRDFKFEGRIVLVGEEPHVPYRRPPLSKNYLLGEATEAQVSLCMPDFLSQREIELLAGRQATAIDREQCTLSLDDGSTLKYDHLVLATGARNRKLAIPGADLDQVFYLRDRDEADSLRGAMAAGKRAVVVGAGFIGLEFATGALKRDMQVTVLELTEHPMARAISRTMSEVFAQAHADMGVNMRYNCAAGRMLGENGRVTAVETLTGEVIPADMVVVGIGVVPNAELAAACGLAVEDGIAVDEYLRTDDPRIFAIGDVCAHPNHFSSTSQRIRVESVQNACDQARTVAAALMGRAEPYRALPWFWSNQGPLRLQIAGLKVDDSEEVVRGPKDTKACSVFLFHGDRLVCVETLNRPADHLLARRLLQQEVNVTPAQAADVDFNLKSLLPPPPAR